MKHVKDAQKLLDQGDAPEALGILESILSLAPRNSQALRLKARILDAWGMFDESLLLLHTLSQTGSLSNEELAELETRAMEEKESIVYSELSSEGRWYFAFPMAQVWISIYGFMGCAAFLLLSPTLLSGGTENVATLSAAFTFFVVVPWLALLAVHVTGVKRILVGVTGLRVCHRFSQMTHPWASLGKAVIEYDHDTRSGYLRLHLYTPENKVTPLVSFDISRRKSVVRARRHFVRNVLSYVDVVCYLPRASTGPGEKPGSVTAENSSAETASLQADRDQNTNSAA